MRWRLVDDEAGQGALFPDEDVVERHVGTGEFRGLEFLHVNARHIINEVPAASRMPFRYTINAYRGCSHACAYCLSGDTRILMGDGRTSLLSDVRVGDVVFGTTGRARSRRYVLTQVLDHWSTVKPAYRITLKDGTQIIASADHRFLSDRGWKFVTGAEQGRDQRPHLTSNNRLLGTGGFVSPAAHVDPAITRKRASAGTAVKGKAPLDVLSVEPLGVQLPMFDLTTGSGDFVANGVISHNCFARPTHEWLELGIGEDFERKIVVKVNAVERARADLRDRKWRGDHVAMGTNTDPYQRAEGKYHLTRGIIQALGEAGNPFSILTKGTLVLRDLDVLVAAARRTSVRLNLSIGTLDPDVWRLLEPGTPHPIKRMEAVARLNDAGIPCGVLVAPVLPGLSDAEDQLAAVVNAAVQAGAVSIGAVSLHLRPGVREHFLSTLAETHPALARTYDRTYRRGAYLPAQARHDLGERVQQLVGAARARFGQPRLGEPPSGFDRPAESAPNGSAQLTLDV